MLDALKFVGQMAADKELIKQSTHICVHGGRLQAGDTKMAIEDACPELAGHSFTVPADKFIQAVAACDGVPKIEMQDEGKRIKISYKRFRVTLPTLRAEDYPKVELRRKTTIGCPQHFIDALKRVFPFTSQDASRPWSLGIWLENGYACATNNVILVRTPIDWTGPPINLPRFAVQEILSISRPITNIHVDETALEIEYGDAWFKTQTYQDKWPQSAVQLFDKAIPEMHPVPDTLLSSIEKLIPFCPDVKFPAIYFNDKCITTADGAQSAEIGFELNLNGAYRAEVLQLVLGAATHWTPQNYPSPIFFKGDLIEGLFVGLKI